MRGRIQHARAYAGPWPILADSVNHLLHLCRITCPKRVTSLSRFSLKDISFNITQHHSTLQFAVPGLKGTRAVGASHADLVLCAIDKKRWVLWQTWRVSKSSPHRNRNWSCAVMSSPVIKAKPFRIFTLYTNKNFVHLQDQTHKATSCSAIQPNATYILHTSAISLLPSTASLHPIGPTSPIQ